MEASQNGNGIPYSKSGDPSQDEVSCINCHFYKNICHALAHVAICLSNIIPFLIPFKNFNCVEIKLVIPAGLNETNLTF